MIKLAINGICGRMGKRILRLAKQDDQINVAIGFEQESHPQTGKEIDGVEVSSDYDRVSQSEAVIDFSAPAGTLVMLNEAKKHKKAMVIGTTNLNKDQLDRVKEASKDISIVYSPNMSVGVNLFFKALRLAASTLGGYDLKIKETHHIHKKDSPSGTAKKLAEIANEFGFDKRIDEIEAKREGEVIGDHQVVFENQLDSFKIIHHAKTRDIFAQGAITAAKWIKGQPAGLYSMEDILFN